MRFSSARSASVSSRTIAAGVRRRLAARGAALAIAAALAPAAAAVVAAPAAQAHSVLVGTTPEQGSTVAEAPETIEVVFNEEISPDFASLTVMADGENVADGDPEVDGDSIFVAVPELDDGTYTVGYRVVSADGHPVQGSWEFTVEAGGAAGSGSSASESTGAEAPGGAEEGANSGGNADSADQAADTEDSVNANADAQDEGMGIWPAMGLLAVLAIALIGGAVFLLQRHKKTMAQFHQDEQ